MYYCIIRLFGKDDYRAKGKTAKGRENRRRKKKGKRASSGGQLPSGVYWFIGFTMVYRLALLHCQTALLITPITLQMSHFQLHVMTANDPVVQSSL